MKTLKAIIGLCCVLALGVGLAQIAKADAWNKKTYITITEPLQIPGAVLTPGKYVFKLMDSSANRHIVRVLKEDETTVVNTIIAIPNERLQPTGKSEFGFWEVPAGHTAALRSWFYPGDNMGQEFAYPNQEATQLSSVVKEQVPSISEEEYAKSTQTEQTSVAKAPEPEPAAAAPAPEVAAAVPPKAEEPAPAAVQQPAPAPAPETTAVAPAAVPSESRTAAATSLPATASPLPLMGILGLASFGLSAGIRVLRSLWR
jgi:outer membrane biosynthesis protein TonB